MTNILFWILAAGAGLYLLKKTAGRVRRFIEKNVIDNPHYQIIGEHYSRVPVSEKVVALTFDDGPMNPYTGELLELLEKLEVRAAFFMQGSRIEADRELARRVLAKGHEAGNHSYSHPHMVGMRPSEIRSEIEKTDALLREIGVRGDIYFRAPYGEKFLALPYVLWRMRRKNILFDFFPEPSDWSSAPAIESARSIVEKTRPGSIIVLHDGNDAGHKVCEIVREVVPRLREKGYAFKTVSELLAAGQL